MPVSVCYSPAMSTTLNEDTAATVANVAHGLAQTSIHLMAGAQVGRDVATLQPQLADLDTVRRTLRSALGDAGDPIEVAVAQLSNSERGVDAMRDLRQWLRGPAGGLDSRNQAAVFALLTVYWSGRAGSVLDAMHDATRRRIAAICGPRGGGGAS